MEERERTWFLFSSHGLCLVYLLWHPDARLSDIASSVGITERRTTQIVRDLESANLLLAQHQGRRKRYTVNGSALGRHPLFAHFRFDRTIVPWLSALGPDSSKGASSESVNIAAPGGPHEVDHHAGRRADIEARLADLKRRQAELAAEYHALLEEMQQTLKTTGDNEPASA